MEWTIKGKRFVKRKATKTHLNNSGSWFRREWVGCTRERDMVGNDDNGNRSRRYKIERKMAFKWSYVSNRRERRRRDDRRLRIRWQRLDDPRDEHLSSVAANDVISLSTVLQQWKATTCNCVTTNICNPSDMNGNLANSLANAFEWVCLGSWRLLRITRP